MNEPAEHITDEHFTEGAPEPALTSDAPTDRPTAVDRGGLFDSPLDDTPPPHPVATLVGGFLMGSADIVPGVSGGTIALVIGIYERLVAQIRTGASAIGRGARGDLRSAIGELRLVQWRFLLPLLAGILTAIVTLAAALEHLLEEQPVLLSGLFLGLVAGSVVMAFREFQERPRPVHVLAMAGTAVAFFGLLGLRSGRVEDPSLVVFFLGGALAVCAMILPGVSGSFILLMLGLYDAVIGVVSDRDLVVAAVIGLGCIVGLALFSTLLHWLLANHHTLVLAVLIGIMAGSLRVLWPWPAGEAGVGDAGLGAPDGQVLPTLSLAVVGFALVVGIARLADRFTGD
jgi:putative membrane protein